MLVLKDYNELIDCIREGLIYKWSEKVLNVPEKYGIFFEKNRMFRKSME